MTQSEIHPLKCSGLGEIKYMPEIDRPVVKNGTLKPYSSVIQVCPACFKVDVYKNDGHDCLHYLNRTLNEDNLWN